jgi:hypothetical protein
VIAVIRAMHHSSDAYALVLLDFLARARIQSFPHCRPAFGWAMHRLRWRVVRASPPPSEPGNGVSPAGAGAKLAPEPSGRTGRASALQLRGLCKHESLAPSRPDRVRPLQRRELRDSKARSREEGWYLLDHRGPFARAFFVLSGNRELGTWNWDKGTSRW